MRYAFALLALAACSEVAIEPPGPVDAGPEAAPAEAAPPDATPYCPGAKAAQACTFTEEPCGDGGITYECGGVGCPTGDMGTCELLATDPLGYWSTACCERKGCVRTYDTWCNPDGGHEIRWFCPVSQRPPGKCRYELGPPGPTSTVAQFCCTP